MAAGGRVVGKISGKVQRLYSSRNDLFWDISIILIANASNER